MPGLNFFLYVILPLWIEGGAAFTFCRFPFRDTARRRRTHDAKHHPPAMCGIITRRGSTLQSSSSILETPSVQSHTSEKSTLTTEFHLLSLCYTPPDTASGAAARPFSKAAADCWRWKDAVLGDGRDFFVPRPKTLKKLGSYLQRELSDDTLEITECMILSNCARFEILLAVSSTTKIRTAAVDKDRISLAVSQSLVAQSSFYQTQVNGATKMMVSTMDWPGVVASAVDLKKTNNNNNNNNKQATEQQAKELQPLWVHTTHLGAITDHLARVAVGIAPRPRRPERTVQFRPFSSRDAHILLQLKRTVDAFSSSSTNDSSSMPQLSKLMQYALQAGKAARDVQRVPALSALVPYGSGDSQKYSTQPPADLLENVTNVVIETVIQPIVQECTSHFRAQSQAQVISKFRSQSETLADTNEELQWIRRRLHKPTMELRKGHLSAGLVESLQQDFLVELQRDLNVQRQAGEPQ